jgi:hypothetical protein
MITTVLLVLGIAAVLEPLIRRDLRPRPAPPAEEPFRLEVFHTKACRDRIAALDLDAGWCVGAGCYVIATGFPVPTPQERTRPFRLPDLRRPLP